MTVRELLPALSLVTLAAGAIHGQEAPMTDTMRAEMNAWMAAAQPGDAHRGLESLVGRWQGTVRMWMDPEQPAMEERGTLEAKMILGGRFLEGLWGGNFGGMPFQGMSIDGYNNVDQRYESVWVDNFGTVMLTYTGTVDDDGVRTMRGSYTDAYTGLEADQTVTYRWIDDDHWLYESHLVIGDREFKNLEIHYERTD